MSVKFSHVHLYFCFLFSLILAINHTQNMSVTKILNGCWIIYSEYNNNKYTVKKLQNVLEQRFFSSRCIIVKVPFCSHACFPCVSLRTQFSHDSQSLVNHHPHLFSCSWSCLLFTLFCWLYSYSYCFFLTFI